MKAIIIKFFCVIVCVSAIVSCSKKEDADQHAEETALVDFGEGVYRPNPFKFLDNIPPFSWLGMPDSVIGHSEITISFNEDAVRSKSSGTIYFADASGNRIEGLQIGDKGQSEIAFAAADKDVTIPVTFRVNPEVGDSLLTGSIMVSADKLDVVNDTELLSYATPVAGWQMKHQTGINWWRWLLLVLVVALILAIIFLICYGLVKAFIAIGVALSPIQVSMPKFNRTKTKKKKKVKKKKKENDENPYLRLIKRKCSRDIYELVKIMHKNGEVQLAVSQVRAKELPNGVIEIWFEGTVTKIRVKGNHIYADAGSLPGLTNPQNEFLNEPLPNKTYHVDNEAAVYRTDRKGRVIYAEANRTKLLKIKRAGRNTSTQSKVTKGDSRYDGGHLFDCANGGANEYINQVPMLPSFNRAGGKWKKMEEEEINIANRAKSCKVKRKIKYPIFSRNAHIPKKIITTIYVNGKRYKRINLINPKP